jgi:methyltransferase family protein
LNGYVLRRRIAVLAKHPSLILQIPNGEVTAARAHMEIELRNARRLYAECIEKKMDTLGMVRAFQEGICYPNSYLYPICRHNHVHTVVETGVFWGNSTAFVLQAMVDNGYGHLWSIDLPNVAADARNTTILGKGMETGFLVPPRLRPRWTLLLGDSKVELPRLVTSLGVIDLFHHDSLHTFEHMTFEYETVWPKLAEGGLLMSDDVDRNPAFDDFCRSHGVVGRILSGKGYAEKLRSVPEVRGEHPGTDRAASNPK